MLRGSEVPRTMRMVEAALATLDRRPPGERPAVTYVVPEHEVDPRMARLRSMATIRTEFHSGSARPIVGGAVRLGKRVVRRMLRWYVQPIMEQQTRFNHAVLDLVDRLRIELEQQVERRTVGAGERPGGPSLTGAQEQGED
ncbi:MAG: hypothetical protein M3203_11255 [Actinomycetota bacterium]|nr:hypothetical protein [Actinomycetota bacterium]